MQFLIIEIFCRNSFAWSLLRAVFVSEFPLLRQFVEWFWLIIINLHVLQEKLFLKDFLMIERKMCAYLIKFK